MIYNQAAKYLEISTCPASQKNIDIHGKNVFFTRTIKTFTCPQPEVLINTSRQVLFSSPDDII